MTTHTLPHGVREAERLARQAKCDHSQAVRLAREPSSVLGGAFEFFYCETCDARFTKTTWPVGSYNKPEWDVMSATRQEEYGLPATDLYETCALCGDPHWLVAGSQVCIDCWSVYDEPSQERVQSILEGRYEDRMTRGESDHDGERDAMREAGRVR